MEFKREELLKKVKREVKSGHTYCRTNGFGSYWKLMLDTDDGEIWVDCFPSADEWKEYISNSIVCLNDENTSCAPDREAECEEFIKNAVGRLKAAGHTVV